MKRLPLALVAALALAAGLAARPAGAVEDMITPRSVAMGDSLRGDASGALGPLLNPAGMSLRRAYTLEAMYGFKPHGLESDIHLSIVDSTTSRLAAGVYYSFSHSSPNVHLDANPVQETRDVHETGLAMSLPIGDKFFLGATLKYLNGVTTVPNPAFNATTNATAPPTFTLDSSTGSSTNGFTFDFGMAIRANTFQMGIVGYNLIPLHTVEAPIGVAAGIAYKPKETLTLAVDARVDFDKFHTFVIPPGTGARMTTVRTGGGLEYLAGGKVALRIGTVYDTGVHGYYVSAGLGYTDPRFSIDLSYRQELVGGLEALLVAGIRVFLQ